MRWMMMGTAAAVLVASACDRSFLHDLPEPSPPTSDQACPTEASPSDVTVSFESEGVTLSWQHRAPAGYETLIERNAENAGFLEVGRAEPGDTSFVDVAAEADVDYTYRLRVEGDGCTSEPSEPVSALTPPLPAASLEVSAAVDELVLSWTDTNDHEAGYLVTRTQSASDPAPIESALPADATSFTDTAVEDDTRYFYSVTALGLNGDATPASIEAWTLALAPLDLSATASALPRVSLSWTAPGDDVTDYVIERASGGSSFSEIAVLAATSTQHDDDDVDEGVSYEYRVMADNPGGRSPSATVSTSVPCFEGGEATELSAAVEAARITLSFASTAPDGYFFVVQRATGAGAFIDIGQTAAGERSFEDDDVALDTAYRYRVAGSTGACTTGLSAVLNAHGLPASPQLFGVSNVGDDLVLAWTDASSVELGYKVERADDGGAFVLLDDTLPSASTGYTDVQPPKDTAFSYRLTARGQDGDSEPVESAAFSRPFAPESLTVVSAGLDALTVSWTDVNDTETQHVIQRALLSDGVFSELAVLGTDVVQYADTGLIEGEAYAYRVTAVNAGGASDAAEGTGATNCTIDIDPHTLSASISPASATLTWQSDAEAEYAFAVERSVDDAAFATLATTNDGARAFVDDTIQPDTRYRYRVRGVFGACQTGLSNVFEAHGLPNAIPAPDRDVLATSVVLYLEDPNDNETGLRVERSASGAAAFVALDTLAPNTTSYTDDTLVAEQAVDYRVVALGLSGETVGDVFSVLTLPAAPIDFAVNVTSPSELTLSWTDPNLAETGYRVYRQGPGELSFTELTTLAASSTGYSDTDVEEGADYAYQLVAYNASGESAHAEASGNPGCTAGTAPTNLSAIVSPTEIELAWTSTASAAYGYRVERSTSGGAFTFVEDTQIEKSFDTAATALDTRYLYRVRAESSYCTSAYSAELQVDGLPNAPGSLDFVASPMSIAISWLDTNSLETGYRVEARPAGSGAFSVVANVAADVVEASHNAVSPDSQYDLRIVAVGADGETAATSSAPVGTPPSTPVVTALAAGTDAINVFWDAVMVAGTYTVERSDGGGGFAVIAEQASAAFSDSGLEAGVLYQYRVQAESSKTGLSSGVGSGSATTFSPPSLSAGSVAVDVTCELTFTGGVEYDPADPTVEFDSASAGFDLAFDVGAVSSSADDSGFSGMLIDDPPHGPFTGSWSVKDDRDIETTLALAFDLDFANRTEMTNRPFLSTLTTVDDNVMVGRQVWFSSQEPTDPGGICFGCGGARGSVAQADSMALVVNRSGGVDGWGAISSNLLSGPQLSRPMPICLSGDPEADCAGGQALSDVRAVFAGGSHACFILSNNTLKCFGEDTEGQLGGGTLVLGAAVGTAVDVCRTEVRTDVPPCADDVLGARAGEAVIAGAAGSQHTCAIIEGGRVLCWGSNSFGQLGDGTLTRRTVPRFVCLEGSTLDDCNGGSYLANAIAIGAGEQHTCAILSGGTVRCWGDNSNHQLGSTDDNETAQTRPVTVCASGDENDGTCVPFIGAAQLASAGRFNCVVTSGGRVDCWGSDNSGTLGNGDGTTEPSRRQHPHPVCVTGDVDDDCGGGDYLIGAAQVAAGYSHACALLQDGTVSCWGDASSGRLGNGELSPAQSRPVSVCAAGATFNDCNGGVDLFSGAIGLSAGSASCALTHRGLKCWGSNTRGQLGPDTGAMAVNPVDICTDTGCPSIYLDSSNRACGEVGVTLQ